MGKMDWKWVEHSMIEIKKVVFSKKKKLWSDRKRKMMGLLKDRALRGF